MKRILGYVLIIVIVAGIIFTKRAVPNVIQTKVQDTAKQATQKFNSINPQALNDPLKISNMRAKDYPGSAITIEQILPDGQNYHQYIASYKSDGLKIYALLTVPTTPKPKDGYPIIVFNHGYIPPATYETDPSVGQYAAYLPVFASNGYVVFKPDYRGNGQSEGKPEGAYYSPAYTTDDLNAVASIKDLSTTSITCTTSTTSACDMFKAYHSSIVNPNKLGVWGHSMGGNVTLRDLVIKPSWIKAAVIWGGVVGSSSDLLSWHDPHYQPSQMEQAVRSQARRHLLQIYGTPQTNPDFWNAIDPTFFVKDITAPVQLHAGEADDEVPPSFSEELYQKLKQSGKTVQLYEYPGADHNISQGFDLAMQRSLAFFDKYLK